MGFKLSLYCLLVVAFLCGCGQKKDPVLDKALAKVNHYTITVGDFKQETGAMRSALRNITSVSEKEVKSAILDDMVTRELLLEEAQKLNIDKNKAFMIQVENFWRLALIKELWAYKTKEIISQVHALQPGLSGEDFKRKVQEGLQAWTEGLKAKARITKHEEELNAISLNDMSSLPAGRQGGSNEKSK